MRGRLDLHAKYRELLAARLDRPLTRAENRLLVAHLKSCAGCRQVERDYRDQSALLRSTAGTAAAARLVGADLHRARQRNVPARVWLSARGPTSSGSRSPIRSAQRPGDGRRRRGRSRCPRCPAAAAVPPTAGG